MSSEISFRSTNDAKLSNFPPAVQPNEQRFHAHARKMDERTESPKKTLLNIVDRDAT